MNDMLAPESQPLTEHMTRGKLNDGERGVMKCDNEERHTCRKKESKSTDTMVYHYPSPR